MTPSRPPLRLCAALLVNLLAGACVGSGSSADPAMAEPPASLDSPAAAGGESPAAAVPAIHVCGSDRSGSYDFVSVGLEMCARVIAAAGPGDEVLMRWISDQSYANSEFIARLTLPVGGEDCSNNRFNAACRRAQRALERQVAALKRHEVVALLALRPSSAPFTDIMGFLQAASDVFAADTLNREHWVYMGTDLRDNVGYHVEPDLRGAHVVVFALQTPADPEQAVALREQWRARLTRLGAVDVQFQTAEVKR